MVTGNFTDGARRGGAAPHPVGDVSDRPAVSKPSLFVWKRRFAKAAAGGTERDAAFVAEHRGRFSVRARCRFLHVQPSGFHAWSHVAIMARA